MHNTTYRIAHTMAFVIEHWLEQEITQWVHHEGSDSPWRIDPMTHCTMSKRSYHRVTSCSWDRDILCPPWRIDPMTHCTMNRCSTTELHLAPSIFENQSTGYMWLIFPMVIGHTFCWAFYKVHIAGFILNGCPITHGKWKWPQATENPQ